MTVLPAKYSFIPLMKLGLILIIWGALGQCFAQDRVIEGIVFDKTTNERIAQVNILNTRTHQSVYNTLKAEFKITARTDDQLIVSKVGYISDTIKVTNNTTLMVYLKLSSIQLKQVNITDTLLSPQKKYEAVRQQFSKAYGSNAYRDPLSLSPGSGAGISIDAIWNSLSKSGRNAEKLQGIIEKDYREDLIDYRFNKTLVSDITGLKEPQLTDFMRKYRPGYYTIMNASDYEFVNQIKMNAKRYLRNPNAFTLPSLK